jgi:hypothetical protein
VDEIRTALASWYPYLKAVHVPRRCGRSARPSPGSSTSSRAPACGLAPDDREARYERMVRHHTTFLHVTEPIVVVLVPVLFVLAVAKPF